MAMNPTRCATMTALICAATLCSVAAQSPAHTTTATRPPITTGAAVAHYTATAPYEGDSGAGAKIDILIERWSTNEERAELSAGLAAGGPDGMLTKLQSIRRRAGVLLMPGVQGAGARARIRRPVNLYFAQKLDTAGGSRLILAADHYLALGQPTVDWPSEFEVSMLDIRFAGDGAGIGKVGLAAKLAYNKDTKTFELANYEAAPARLLTVRAEKP
jgi:hypothetical protein